MIFGYIYKEGKKFSVAYRDFNLSSKQIIPNVGVNFCPGFLSEETAIEWFMIRYGQFGNLTTKQSFDEMTQNMIHKNPVTPSHLDPTYMKGLDRPGKPYKRGESSFE